jgi:hypothetical protein
MATHSRLFIAAALAGCAYALGRRVGRASVKFQPIKLEAELKLRGRDLLACLNTESYRQMRTRPSGNTPLVKPTVFDVSSHYSAIGEAIRAHAQTVLDAMNGKGITGGTISEIVSSHAQEISDAIKRLEYGMLRTTPTPGGEPPHAE